MMPFRSIAVLVFAASAASCSSSSSDDPGVPAGGDGTYVDEPYPTLDRYGLLTIREGAIVPAKETVHYDLNTPLFSDYARKERTIFLPRGTSMTYKDDGTFDFPVGAIITKSFGFPQDFRDPHSKVRWEETRLLIRAGDGWKTISYQWDEAQKVATKVPGGRTRTIEFIDGRGTTQHANYLIPSANQCPKCHANNGVSTPIGLYAAQINRTHTFADGTQGNQIAKWNEMGLLAGAPASVESAPRLPVWDDPNVGLNDRARSYLDGNCAYCHSTTGEARTSGLYLGFREMDPLRLGVCKIPVAAGRAGSNLDYDVVPGNPDKSILTYRMDSTEPSIAMPELGRSLVHAEALALVREWVSSLQGNCK
ncbi:hypothetical protein LVJ94_37435 [Pendulispora rubella]|uniref:Cytochrome c domain-containing protein n=1 Tax=Pendulispora rubella TaxID=2741070 RepID=A0ABZ2KV78_9BACT